MADKMMGLSDPAMLIKIAEDFLISRLKSTNEERTYLEEATNIIRIEKGNISIDSLCKRLYVSERQLQRSFKDMLGTSPKTYTRIIRFRNAYEYIQQTKNDKVSMADISYNCGYADQAHFIRDFKEFAGITPSIVEDSNMQFCQVAPKYALS
jgi:AraC-like DNA-binding protein